jgi:hypothetical protein
MNQRFQPYQVAPERFEYEELATLQLSAKMKLKLCRDLGQRQLICLDLRKYYLPAEGGDSGTKKGIYLDIDSWRWVHAELGKVLASIDKPNGDIAG